MAAFLFLIILFTIGLFEYKLMIPVFRMFIQFVWNIIEMSSGSKKNIIKHKNINLRKIRMKQTKLKYSLLGEIEYINKKKVDFIKDKF